MSLTEEKLKCHPNTAVSNVIQHQFRGNYEYCTICSKCGVESTCPSEFYELDLNIEGLTDLYQCIEGFLKVTKSL